MAIPGNVVIVPPGMSPEREAEVRRVKRRRNSNGEVLSKMDIPSLRTGFRLPRAARNRHKPNR